MTPTVDEKSRSLAWIPRLASLSIGVAALVLAGCGDATEPDLQQVNGEVHLAGGAPATAATVSFQALQDDVGARAASETRVLIRTARGYQSFFGHAPPTSVDFSREWVMFYAAGTKTTGGFEASFLALLRAGNSLIAITQLVSPCPTGVVTQATSTPFALIKFSAQPGTSAQFFRQDRSTDCGAGACASVQCPTGSDCDPSTGTCVPGKVVCGGIAGLACPGMGKCADDPSDACDPSAGGVDCSGACSCVQTVACVSTSHFDSSPSVCACVPNPTQCGPVCDIYCANGHVLDANGCPTCACNPPATNLCAAVQCQTGSDCDPATGKCIPSKQCPPVCAIYCDYGNVLDANGCPTCTCNPPPTDPCATVRCASGTHCAAGQCVKNVQSCGGFTGKPCPGSGMCVDDPADTCDPTKGGADCGGICTCVQNVACVKGSTFDSSPAVCACVPTATITCAADACTGPGPKSVTTMCADGTTAGPTCAAQADGKCAWTVTTCPPTR